MHKESWIFKSDKIIISKIFDKVHNNLKSKLLFELVKKITSSVECIDQSVVEAFETFEKINKFLISHVNSSANAWSDLDQKSIKRNNNSQIASFFIKIRE